MQIPMEENVTMTEFSIDREKKLIPWLSALCPSAKRLR
jgi:hypothetical protein